jgi:hypothetical protein
MDESKREAMIATCAQRLVENLESMTPYSKFVYMKKLVAQLDDMRLIALNFAVEMTPNQGGNNAE